MAFLTNIGPAQLLIVLGIAILILGPKRIPEAAKSIGASMRNFQSALGSGDDEEKPKSEVDEKTNTEA